MSAEPQANDGAGGTSGLLERAVERAAKLVVGVRGLIAAAAALLCAGGLFALATAQVPTKSELNTTVAEAIAKHASEPHADMVKQIDALRDQQADLKLQQAVEVVNQEWTHEALRRLLDAQGLPHPPEPRIPTIGPAPLSR